MNAPSILRRRALAETMAPWLGVSRARTSARRSQGLAVSRASAEFRRLVVAPPPQPVGMQRHRQDDVGFGQQGAPAAIQPAREAGCEIEPVAVLERQDRTAAGLVVAHHGARLVIGRRFRLAGGAQRRAARIEFEDEAAALAHRAVEKADRLPAARAQRARLGDGRTAADAQRREDEIERGARGALQSALQPPTHVAYASAMSDGPPQIFDRKALELHRARARRMSGAAFLAETAADGIVERLGAIRRDFRRILPLDEFLEPDERLVADGAPFDLVTSVLRLHAINDLPGVLVQARHALKPDGLFLAALFGGETLTELRQSLAAAEIETQGGVSPRVAPFGDVRDLGGLLQRAGFALPVADVERTVVRYSAFSSLLRDLRAMGETNALVERSRKPVSRAMLAAALAHYAEHFADPDGKLRATFDIVYLTGWAPHENQQQPLKPGSAKSRLAQALGTTERGAGEKPG